MKIDAGALLKSQKPQHAPAEHAESAATKNWPPLHAATVKKRNAIAAGPTDRPSMLSKKFMAFMMKTIQKTEIGTVRNGVLMKIVM